MCKINGKKLGEIRENAGMSRKEFAEMVGVSNSMICNYENGRYNPSDATLDKICMVLKISKDDIEIKNVSYDFKNGTSKVVAKMRKNKSFKRKFSPIEVEDWISERRDVDKEKEEVISSLNSAVSFGIMKKYIVIDPTCIHVPAWQRDTDMAKAEEICQNYAEEKFDPVKAFLNNDNQLIGTDGVHRVVARIKRNEILKKEGKPSEKIIVEIIPCTEENAVDIFREQEAGRKPMTIGDMYRASIEVKDPDFMKLKEIFESYNIQVSEELTKNENAIGVIRPSRSMLRLATGKTDLLCSVLSLIKDLDWCGSTTRNAYTLRNIKVLIKLITVHGDNVKQKLIDNCKGSVYYESKVFPIKSNAELYDMLSEEISK